MSHISFKLISLITFLATMTFGCQGNRKNDSSLRDETFQSDGRALPEGKEELCDAGVETSNPAAPESEGELQLQQNSCEPAWVQFVNEMSATVTVSVMQGRGCQTMPGLRIGSRQTGGTGGPTRGFISGEWQVRVLNDTVSRTNYAINQTITLACGDRRSFRITDGGLYE